MRVPWSKAYRAFPEFDRLSDEDCERYLLGLRRQGRLRWWKPILTFLLAVPLLSVPLLAVLGWFFSGPGVEFVVWLDGFEFGPNWSLSVLFFGGLVPLILWGLPHGVALIARDRVIRQALKKQINLALCASCRQSLIGLPFIQIGGETGVRCPECGERWTLVALGLVPDDIRPRPAEEPG